MKSLKLSQSKTITLMVLGALSIQLVGCGDDQSKATLKELSSATLQVEDFELLNSDGIVARFISPRIDFDGTSTLNLTMMLSGDEKRISLEEVANNQLVAQWPDGSLTGEILEKTDSSVKARGLISEDGASPDSRFLSGALTREFSAEFRGEGEEETRIASESVKGVITGKEGKVYDLNFAWAFDDSSREERSEFRASVKQALAELRSQRAQMSKAEINQRLVEIANSEDFNASLGGIQAGGTIKVDGREYSYRQLLKLMLISLAYAFASDSND